MTRHPVAHMTGYTSRTRPSSFLMNVLQNGVGRPVKQLKRITVKFSDFSKESRWVRLFVEKDLINFARKHPTVVLYAVPEADARPRLLAEFLNGREEIHSLAKLDLEDINILLDTLCNRSGLEIVRIRKDHHTHVPSIQGEWHPFLNKKSYDITKPLDFSTKLYDAWTPVGSAWKHCYRQHELHKLHNRPKLTYNEKAELPLGKWGPVLKPQY